MLNHIKNTICNILQAQWFTLNYHGTRLKLPFNPRKGTCLACGRKGYTNIHHWCFAAGTMVHTEKGFLPIEEIFDNHYRINVETHTGNFHKIVNDNVRTVNELISIKTVGTLPIISTPEHQYYTAQWRYKYYRQRKAGTNDMIKSFTWKKAKDINKNDLLLIPKHKRTQEFTTIDLKPFIISHEWIVNIKSFPINEETAWLMGNYLANGSSAASHQHINFTMNINKSHIADKIQTTLKNINVSSSRQIDKSRKCIRIYAGGPILARFFRDTFGKNAHEKHIPDFIFYNKNSKVVQAFIKGFFDGDGHNIKRRGSIYLSTCSKNLAYQFQKLMTSFDLFMNMQLRIQKDSIFKNGYVIKGGKPLYQIHSSSPTIAEFFGKTPHKGKRLCQQYYVLQDYIALSIKKITNINEKSQVYNISVETDESYTANNFAVHNCYRYSRKEVMQNNMLALNFTTEVCFTCHELANSLRKLFTESPNMAIKKPSPIIKKLLELRKTALEKGECFAKLEETDPKTTQECEKVSKNRTKRSKNKKHRADGNSK
jgi:hypothetical protein